ncbi:dTDP-4-dehydrorhamnose 3,5-epimerase [Kordiimonas aestuarii]|uniref:dTDP-4-dehydrorhamnose 3,5-epimerase n=1 Tax=Kordiimonas aestuarii TaxID=1005925 RepID=UPI0021D318A6|nr:dTDP-4-dehydrorhamnose 3,5-epimerase [Kordiimonas aestuarii]
MMSETLPEGIELTPLKRIHHPQGDIYHALKASEGSFSEFGEAYFTTVTQGETKGWKQHTRMTMNLVVPVGDVTFFLRHVETGQHMAVTLGADNYCRLTVAPGYWMAFKGEGSPLNLVLNIASIEHDPGEAVNVALETYPLER